MDVWPDEEGVNYKNNLREFMAKFVNSGRVS